MVGRLSKDSTSCSRRKEINICANGPRQWLAHVEKLQRPKPNKAPCRRSGSPTRRPRRLPRQPSGRQLLILSRAPGWRLQLPELPRRPLGSPAVTHHHHLPPCFAFSPLTISTIVPTKRTELAMDFSVEDGKRLWSLVRKQEVLVDKKRRWLESMTPKSDGCNTRLKRPKFLADAFLAESDIRSDEVSCEKVTASVAKSYGLQRGGHNHHLVQDGLRLLNLPRGEDGSLSPESLNIMHSTINKLSNGALQSVAKIISRTKCSFNKTRPLLREIVTYHLPCYLAKLDHEDVIMSELSEILINPGSYQSDSLSLVTPVSPLLLSSINQALDRLDGIPDQALVAVNRKLIGKTSMPKFWHVPRSSSRGHLIEIVRKRCKMIIARIEEGYMPKRLAKAMSMVNLYWKQKLRSMDISQLEYFPFSKETASLQNDVLNALWLLPKLQHDDLKLLRPILDPDPKFRKMQFRVSLRKYFRIPRASSTSTSPSPPSGATSSRDTRKQAQPPLSAKSTPAGPAQSSSSSMASTGHTSDIICRRCKGRGHFARECKSQRVMIATEDVFQEEDCM
ncbi:uncharacterized protein [Aegilops tauschii subsp. strangulata]|uniref:uncharacterized protein n=1 Tax=Aegilops tauschii subsp. strangulata TaxID=200361 RepID=UPI003CC8AA68